MQSKMGELLAALDERRRERQPELSLWDSLNKVGQSFKSQEYTQTEVEIWECFRDILGAMMGLIKTGAAGHCSICGDYLASICHDHCRPTNTAVVDIDVGEGASLEKSFNFRYFHNLHRDG